MINQSVESLYGLTGSETVDRSIHAVIDKTVNGRGSHMHAGIARSIVYEHLAVLVGYPSVGEEYIHDIAHILLAHGAMK